MKNVFILTSIKIINGNSAGAARLLNISRALALEGVNVYLCSSTCRINIQENTIKEISKNIFSIGQENNDSHNNWFRRLKQLINIIYEFSYCRNIYKLAHNIQGRNIFYIYPQPEISIDIISIFYLKLLKRQKIFIDINELRVTGLYNTVFSNKVLKMFYEKIKYVFDFVKFKLHERLTRYFDGVVVISTNLEKYFRRYNKNIIRIPILSNIDSTLVKKDLKYDNNKDFQIGFTGQVNLKKEGFDILYMALSIIKKQYKNFKLNLYGPIDNHVKNLLLNELPLHYDIKDNIIYHGIKTQSVLVEELQKNDLLILPRPLHPQTHFGFSTKLSEYLVSSVPVLVTDVSDNSLYIKDNINGFVVEPGNSVKMSEKIIYIMQNYNTIVNKIVDNALTLVKKEFYYTNYSKILCKFIFSK